MVIDAYLFIAHKIDEANYAPKLQMMEKAKQRSRALSSVKPQKTLKAVKISTRPTQSIPPPVTVAMITPISIQAQKPPISEPIPKKAGKFEDIPKVIEEDEREMKGVKVNQTEIYL